MPPRPVKYISHSSYVVQSMSCDHYYVVFCLSMNSFFALVSFYPFV